MFVDLLDYFFLVADLFLQFFSVFLEGRIAGNAVKPFHSTSNTNLLLIHVSLDLAQPLVEGVLVAGLLIRELALKLLSVLLDVVVVVAHREGLDHIVPAK